MNRIIFEAWKNALEFVENSQDEENDIELKPEYLIVVKIADQIINKFIKMPMSDFALKLEEKTSLIYKRCFTESKRIESLKFLWRSKKDSLLRKGRLDLTIYKKEYFNSLDRYQTYAVVEIKNLENSFKKIKNDIIRIKELISIKDEISSNFCRYGIVSFSKKCNKQDKKYKFSNNKFNILMHNKEIIKEKLGLKIDEDIYIKIYNLQGAYGEHGRNNSYFIFNIIIQNPNYRLKINI